MLIAVNFQFNDESVPAATTGVEGQISDMIMPSVGDMVRHCDLDGYPFLGTVTNRIYKYDVANGVNVEGRVVVTLLLDRVAIN